MFHLEAFRATLIKHQFSFLLSFSPCSVDSLADDSKNASSNSLELPGGFEGPDECGGEERKADSSQNLASEGDSYVHSSQHPAENDASFSFVDDGEGISPKCAESDVSFDVDSAILERDYAFGDEVVDLNSSTDFDPAAYFEEKEEDVKKEEGDDDEEDNVSIGVGIVEGFHCIQRCLHFRGLE